jgi:polyphosphate kinase
MSSRNMTTDFSNPSFYINRELSWLQFNRRVLEEAQDIQQPLLERLRFICIFSSNLDEFFEIRVAGIKQQIENEISDVAADGLSATQIFHGIRKEVLALSAEQYKLWHSEIRPELAKLDILVREINDLSPKDLEWATRYFREEVFPVLTPLAVDSSHPFPQLRNKSHNLILLLRRPDNPHEISYGIVQIPRVLPRLVRLPESKGKGPRHHYFLLKDIIKHQVSDLYPGLEVQAAYAFRITRNSDLYFDEEEAENLLRTIEDELRKRNRGNAVRLEVQPDCPPEVQSFLLDFLKLSQDDLYINDGPLNFLHLLPLCSIDTYPQLRDKPYIPIYPRALPPEADVFEVMRRQDILLHHPYESFNSIIDFVHRAAQDPHVLAIKMTLYRTSGDSPVVRALIQAAENGKQVTALVELRARFDEANNINWARQMEEAGVHVVYGVVGLKTHCKMLMVVRRDDDRIRHYVHLGTGNYHPSTARIYSDLGLLTTQPELTLEVATLFNTLTGLSDFQGIHKLMVAPFELAERFKELINHERDLALAGKPGRIIVKVNALVDEEIIQALYEASVAGAKIDLVIRGICCLRPKLKGVSENIRVVSIVGRFLEHSRIYFFGNDGDPKIYLGSADWMPRNLHRRVEVVFPIEDPRLKKRLQEEIIPIYLTDCIKARELQSDGSYVRLCPKSGAKPSQAQLTFRELARRQNTSNASEPGKIKIKPILSPSDTPAVKAAKAANK